MKRLYVVVLILLLTNCSTLMGVQDKSAESMASAIKTYCAVTLQSERAVLRADLNARLDGLANITIICLGDFR